jgi:hypothetical protein
MYPSSLLPGTPTHIIKVHTFPGPFPHVNTTSLYPATSPPLLFFFQIKTSPPARVKVQHHSDHLPQRPASAVVIPNVVQHYKTVLVSRRPTSLLSPGKDFLTLIKCYSNSKNELTTRSIRTILLSNPHLLQKRQLLTLDSKGLYSRAHSSQQNPSLSSASKEKSEPNIGSSSASCSELERRLSTLVLPK